VQRLKGLWIRRIASGMALVLTLAVGAQAASAKIWQVNTTADPGSGCTAANCTLRAAVGSAASGDTIDVPAGHYVLTAGVITIPNSVTIVGAGAAQVTIDANMASQVFSIPLGGALNLNGVTVTGGSQPQGVGGDIYDAGALTVDASTITNGTAARGGDIYTEANGTPGASLVVMNSTISGGSTGNVGSGGGLFLGAGAAATIVNTTVSGNTVPGSNGQGGGGIFNAGTMSITGSTIAANTVGSGGSGGGIFDAGTLTLTNSTITGNAVTNGGTGGGILGQDDMKTLSVTNTTIDANSSATGANLYFSTFTPPPPKRPPPSPAPIFTGAAAPTFVATPGFENTIVADALGGGSNCASNATMPSSNGHNLEDDVAGSCGFSTATQDLVGVSPNLGPLADNGGPTRTMALLTGSPAVDAGATITGITTDQRGFPRPQPPGGAFDIGAYEQGALVDLGISMTGSPHPVTVGHQLTYTLTVQNDGPTSDPASGVSLTDLMPAGVTFHSVTASQGACTQSAGSIACQLGVLNRPDVATVTVTVIPQAVGTAQNSGMVSGDGQDPNMANNSASLSVLVDDRPAVHASPAQNVLFTTATLRGKVNPNNAGTTYHFEYGPTTSYGSHTTGMGIGHGTSAVAVSNALHGLQPGTVYHFRIVATNAVGQAFSKDRTFRTPYLPSIHVHPSQIRPGELLHVYGNAGTCPVGSTLTLLSKAFPVTHTYLGLGAIYTTVHALGFFSTYVTVPSSVHGGSYPVSGRCGQFP
jgi:uncharacterized repeat protein (TIGR01451 family)